MSTTMPFRSSNSTINNTPSVKNFKKTQPSSTYRLKGWLNKQRHGKFKAWVSRYFVLYGDELRYYNNENETDVSAVILLDHYCIVPNAQPTTTLNKKKRMYNTFCLVSDDENKYDWPDYFLQAPNAEKKEEWIQHLTTHVNQSTSVLDKWLDRLHIPQENILAINSLDSHNDNTLLSPLSPLGYQEDNSSYYARPSSPSISLMLPTNTSSADKSTDSIALYATRSTSSIMLNSISSRRPSAAPTNKSLDIFSKVLSLAKPKSSSSSFASVSDPAIVEINSSELLSIPNTPTVNKATECYIIHPSEYNQDSNIMTPISRRITDYSDDIDATSRYYYEQSNGPYPNGHVNTSALI